MRNIFLVVVITVTAIFVSCKKDATAVVVGNYNYMHFETAGGGQIDFNIYPTISTNQLKVTVNKYSFRDTTIELVLDKNADNAAAFAAYTQATHGQVQINGDFKQSTLPTGTWSYIYCVANGSETEITNTDLRNTLMSFQQLVRSKIQ